MGLEITRSTFEAEDYSNFSARLEQSLEALKSLLARPYFGVGPHSVGAELELNLVDEKGLPSLINREVLLDTLDDRVTLEVDRFNLEINARPSPLAGRPFQAMQSELASALLATRRAAASHGAEVVTIGILPTLESTDLESAVLSEGKRYQALSAGVRRIRKEPFRFEIHGEDTLSLLADDVTFEGANTSFQVHLRVNPEDFARTYNAAQLATSVVLAASGNSPFFLGKHLWQETRVALFRQSVDDRTEALENDWRPARVSFGHGWVRQGAFELFEESVALHEPLLPVLGSEDPLIFIKNGKVPALAELRLHHGTVWRWNRAVYDDAAGGHLRIELRALPAGPTVCDMVANAALLIGLTLGLAPSMDRTASRMTFGQARRNFYEAARLGLKAELLWPAPEAPSPKLISADKLLLSLLPIAHSGLANAGVDPDEAGAQLGLLENRVKNGSTGSTWQLRCCRAFGSVGSMAARQAMLRRYSELSLSDTPVHTWKAFG